ncbi:hypothetical protein [Acinetobacter sp. 10FS3-1]|uniref:hypothetical protein n=1 Tax=Acinetobacter sp. 10FS3-1 TaxID=2563897 RepID=UPI0015D2571E|nr:hypothetical protein [Acinetobacter sp. 10FS3-1]
MQTTICRLKNVEAQELDATFLNEPRSHENPESEHEGNGKGICKREQHMVKCEPHHDHKARKQCQVQPM